MHKYRNIENILPRFIKLYTHMKPTIETHVYNDMDTLTEILNTK